MMTLIRGLNHTFFPFSHRMCYTDSKHPGDITFITQTIESQEIIHYLERRWYPECLYLLAMVDYLSRENHIPLRVSIQESVLIVHFWGVQRFLVYVRIEGLRPSKLRVLYQ